MRAIRILQEGLLRDPLSVDPFEPPDLPPAFSTDDVLEFLWAEPFNKRIGCFIAGRERYLDWHNGTPEGCWYVRVCARNRDQRTGYLAD